MVNLFLCLSAIEHTACAILAKDQVSNMVDPIPQALVLTSIVIGLAVTRIALWLLLSEFIKIWHLLILPRFGD